MKKGLLLLCLFIIFVVSIIVVLKKNNSAEHYTINKYNILFKGDYVIKIDVAQKCNKNSKCENPYVEKYEVIDAEDTTIFADSNLLSDSDVDHFLINLYELLIENDSSFTHLELTSNWDEINDYITNFLSKYSTDIQVVDEAQIKDVSEDVPLNDYSRDEKENTKVIKEEVKGTVESEKETEKALNDKPNVIKLADKVKISYDAYTYECVGCFSTAFLNKLSNSKGYNLIEGIMHIIFFEKVTFLSGNYNSNIYFGEDYNEEITSFGATQVAHTSKKDLELTMDLCNKYHLVCQ